MASELKDSGNDESNNQINSNRYSAKKIASNIGRGTLVAGGAVVSGAVAATAWTGNKLSGGSKKFASDVRELTRYEEGTGLLLFFIVAILAHLFDAYTKFERNGVNTMLIIYVTMMILAFFFLFEMRVSGDEGVLAAVIAFAYLLPYIPDFFPNSAVMLTFSGIIFLFPVLPLYLGLKFGSNSTIGTITKWYIVFWVLVLVFFLLTTYNTGQTTVAKIKDPMAGVRYVFTGVGTTLNKVQYTFKNTVNKAIATATGQAYEGQEESKVGIYLENVKSLESKYTTSSNVYVEAKVRAISVKEPINVTLLCYITGVQQGSVNPSILTEVEGNYENIVTCNFGKLPAGVYTARVVAVFEFESSSDIEYTFVDSNVKSDQYTSLGINSVTIATYTGGPVELGLPALSQPLRVNTAVDLRDSEITTYPFGVSLKNKWPQGKINKGISYVLDVPTEVDLIDCSRNITDFKRNNFNNNRKEYMFSIDTSLAQDAFDAVSCRMKFIDTKGLLDNNIKSTKTFAAKAKYEYSIEATAPVTVERN